jgi:GNAT superfamily N-acetyltransferase
MFPLIRPGDRVRFDVGAPWGPGDVVLCRGKEGAVIVHRVVHAGDPVILRGDANPHLDPPVPRSDVVGKVTHVVRGGREIALDRAVLRVYGAAMRAATPLAAPLHALALAARSAGGRVLAGPLGPVVRAAMPAVLPPRLMPDDFLRTYLVRRGAAEHDPIGLAAALGAGDALLVAAEDARGRLAAVAEARRAGAGFELRYIWVHPLHRRRGLGTEVLRVTREAVTARGAKGLHPAPGMPPCRRMEPVV